MAYHRRQLRRQRRQPHQHPLRRQLQSWHHRRRPRRSPRRLPLRRQLQFPPPPLHPPPLATAAHACGSGSTSANSRPQQPQHPHLRRHPRHRPLQQSARARSQSRPLPRQRRAARSARRLHRRPPPPSSLRHRHSRSRRRSRFSPRHLRSCAPIRPRPHPPTTGAPTAAKSSRRARRRLPIRWLQRHHTAPCGRQSRPGRRSQPRLDPFALRAAAPSPPRHPLPLLPASSLPQSTACACSARC